MQIAENIDSMFEYMPFKSRWSPVDNFIQLGGVVKCFQVFFFELIIVFYWIVAWIQSDNADSVENILRHLQEQFLRYLRGDFLKNFSKKNSNKFRFHSGWV